MGPGRPGPGVVRAGTDPARAKKNPGPGIASPDPGPSRAGTGMDWKPGSRPGTRIPPGLVRVNPARPGKAPDLGPARTRPTPHADMHFTSTSAHCATLTHSPHGPHHTNFSSLTHSPHSAHSCVNFVMKLDKCAGVQCAAAKGKSANCDL